MIIGIGIDLAELARIERVYHKFGSHFLKKFLTPLEISLIPVVNVPYLASRFAAKEAAVKAMGTGFGQGIDATQIEILTNNFGQPYLNFYAAAKKKVADLGMKRNFISISHERSCAVAVVVLED